MSTPRTRAEYRASDQVKRWQPSEKTAKALDGEQYSSICFALHGKTDEIKLRARAAWHDSRARRRADGQHRII